MKKKIKRLKIDNKIQSGKITYSDLNSPEKPIFSRRYRLSGKPDYIIYKNDSYFPVEIKTGNHFKPKRNHIFQLATYCKILEDYYKIFIPYGFLIYSDTSKQFKIPFDPKTRFELESAIKKMRNSLKTDIIKRDHIDYQRCKNCSMREYCDKKII